MSTELERPLSVVGLGCTTSVGWDAASAAAAVRAGISRAGEVPGAFVLDEETHEPTPVIGHAVRGLTDGFVLFGRWMRLASMAVNDLLADSSEAELDVWRTGALVLATRVADDAVFLDEPEEIVPSIEVSLGHALLEETGLPIPTNRVEVVPWGDLAGVGALARASTLLGQGCSRVLVLAVDSLLDPPVLELLDGDRRLKHAGNPIGLAPGEAAAAVAVANPGEGKPLATVRSVAVAGGQGEGDPPARSGSQWWTFGTALHAAGLPALAGDLWLDLNGELWRSEQWGETAAKLGSSFQGPVQLPATSIGDVGAATSLVSLGLACRSFARGYAADSWAGVLSSGPRGESSCLFVQAAGA